MISSFVLIGRTKRDRCSVRKEVMSPRCPHKLIMEHGLRASTPRAKPESAFIYPQKLDPVENSLVPREGFEPSRIAPYAPQTYAYTSSATWAN